MLRSIGGERGWEWDGAGAAPAKGIVLPGPVEQISL
jgi:hypothetical protein